METNTENKLQVLPQELNLVVEQMDSYAISLLSNQKQGIEKSLLMGKAITYMKSMLTDSIMQEYVMPLQGSKLGFRTDKDKATGYDIATVRNCFVEAFLLGIQTVGNQFNIIAGNMYVTKEGFTYLLKQIQGLNPPLITYPSIKFSQDKSTADATCLIQWELNGIENEKEVTFTIKAGSYATYDAIMGKAERKAKCWLYNSINGTNLTDGDIQDLGYADEVGTKRLNGIQIKKTLQHIESAQNLTTLQAVFETVSNSDNEQLQTAYLEKESLIVTDIIQKSTKLSALEKLEIMVDISNYQELFDAKKTELIHA